MKSSKNDPLLIPHVIPFLLLISSFNVVTGISIFGKVKKATKFPQYVVTKTNTTSHHVPIMILPLSASGRYIPPETENLLHRNIIIILFNIYLAVRERHKYTKSSCQSSAGHLDSPSQSVHRMETGDEQRTGMGP